MANTSESSDEFYDALEELNPRVDKTSGATKSQRFHELRHSMQNDEDENPGNILTPDSQNSSAEGVYISTSRSNYPFRVIESDVASIHSISSLGIVGRIMAGGSVDASGLNVGKDSSKRVALKPAERSSTDPDVITSTKQQMSASKGPIFSVAVAAERPVVPPRRKKKQRKVSSSSSEQFNTNEGLSLPAADSSSSEVLMVKLPPPLVTGTIRKDSRGTNTNSSSTTGSHGGNSASGSEAITTTVDSYHGPTLPSPVTLESITREIENSFEEAASVVVTTSISPDASSNSSPSAGVAAIGGSGDRSDVQSRKLLTGSMNRLTHVVGSVWESGIGGSVVSPLGSSNCPPATGTSTSSVSPSGSIKSNSAPARVSLIDGGHGLNIYKAIKGQYVVKPTDGAFNKAEGPSREEIARLERIRKEFLNNVGPTTPLVATSSAPIGFPSVNSGVGGGSGVHRKNLSYTGTSSLESGTRVSTFAKQLRLKERRKSAGDEDMLKQLNMYVRTHTDSGKQLTDMEILEQVPVKNLDTGENFPLSAVEEKLPQCINPLSLHIMRLTSHIPETDEESVGPQPDSDLVLQPGYEEELESEGGEGGRLKRRTAKLKRFFRSTAKKTVNKAKSIASEVSHARHKEDVADIQDVSNPEQNIKIKASSTNKGPYDFAKLQHVQDLSGEHTVAVWCMKFSSCGRLLATAGQDRMLRIWVLKDAYPFFQDMRTKYNADQKSSPTPSQESLNSLHNSSHISAEVEASALEAAADNSPGPFMPKSFCTYTGHTSDLLDLSWSKNYFLLSSSMDKTVRLWHISRRECLCCFQHIDFVTAIAFHPRDDRYFLSGSLDGKLRLWNIPEKKVALWNEVDGQTKLITAANFCENGKFAMVGTYDGRCIFYNTDQLKYHTQIHVRSTRGRNAIGRKISGIESMPGEDKILVTSNDSRIRLYDLRDLNLSCKYKGYFNSSSQIKASFSHDGKYIISGSENQCIYIWKTHHEYNKLSSVRRDRSDFWEGIKAHNATVTCAIFAPHPEAIIKSDPDEINLDNLNVSMNQSSVSKSEQQRKNGCRGYVLVSVDFNGCIKVFVNKTKPKHSSLPYTAIAE
ncbi:WD repeat-containing protein 44 [Anopheles cruzii]|uniref:WD repeat-containing protein 44 n=1 Tax=Anopheles cruzii TaxID=68878 RepID=UPI0022EC8050|nr:WD repeat-containing protein 44 [Anopheles cruzii]